MNKFASKIVETFEDRSHFYDPTFLSWIADRLIDHYGETENEEHILNIRKMGMWLARVEAVVKKEKAAQKSSDGTIKQECQVINGTTFFTIKMNGATEPITPDFALILIDRLLKCVVKP